MNIIAFVEELILKCIGIRRMTPNSNFDKIKDVGRWRKKWDLN